jgi:hypothetical protein
METIGRQVNRRYWTRGSHATKRKREILNDPYDENLVKYEKK